MSVRSWLTQAGHHSSPCKKCTVEGSVSLQHKRKDCRFLQNTNEDKSTFATKCYEHTFWWVLPWPTPSSLGWCWSVVTRLPLPAYPFRKHAEHRGASSSTCVCLPRPLPRPGGTNIGIGDISFIEWLSWDGRNQYLEKGPYHQLQRHCPA